jgi:hypothetical protein
MSSREIAGLLCVLALPLSGLAAWGLYRLSKRLEKAGLLAQRERSGAGAGLLFELDKLTRPSIEHVAQTQDEHVVSDEQGGE